MSRSSGARFSDFLRRLWSQQWKQDHIADGARIGQQHGEAVDAYTFPTRRWQTIGKRPDVIFVHHMRLFIATLALLQLLLEAPPLLFRIVELAEGVADFQAAYKDLEALHPVGFVLFVL